MPTTVKGKPLQVDCGSIPIEKEPFIPEEQQNQRQRNQEQYNQEERIQEQSNQCDQGQSIQGLECVAESPTPLLNNAVPTEWPDWQQYKITLQHKKHLLLKVQYLC